MTQQTINVLIGWSAVVLIIAIIAGTVASNRWAWAFRARWDAPNMEARLRRKLAAEARQKELERPREEAQDVPG